MAVLAGLLPKEAEVPIVLLVLFWGFTVAADPA
jgi:hypothetical protein